MRYTLVLLPLLFVFSGRIVAQSGDGKLPSKDSLVAEVKRIQRGEDDQIRYQASERLDRIILNYLMADSSVDRNPEIASNISCIIDPGGRWRILTWVVPSYDGDKYDFHGYLQWKSVDGKRILLQRLVDSTSYINKPESERLSPDRWFGAAYYQVIGRRRSRKNYYVLLGWKGKDRKTTQKVIEVLSFDGDKPRFGYPLFKKEKVFRSRVVFTFMSQVSLSLRYEPAKHMIVFDHLFVPKTEDSGTPDQTMAVPDGSYDGYVFRRGKWQWKSDLNMRSKSAPR